MNPLFGKKILTSQVDDWQSILETPQKLWSCLDEVSYKYATVSFETQDHIEIPSRMQKGLADFRIIKAYDIASAKNYPVRPHQIFIGVFQDDVYATGNYILDLKGRIRVFENPLSGFAGFVESVEGLANAVYSWNRWNRAPEKFKPLSPSQTRAVVLKETIKQIETYSKIGK